MKKLLSLAITLFVSSTLLFSQEEEGVLFEFKQIKGDASSYISTVQEDAYFNGILNNHAEIINPPQWMRFQKMELQLSIQSI